MILIRFKDGEREYELEADADELPAVIAALTNPRAKVYAERNPPVLAKDLPPYVPQKYITGKTKSEVKALPRDKDDDPYRPFCKTCHTAAYMNKKGSQKRKFGGVSFKYKCSKCGKAMTVVKTAMDVARDNPKEPVVREKRVKKEKKKELNEKRFSSDEARIDALCPKCDSNDIALSSKNTLKDGTEREYYRCRTCSHNFNNKKPDEAGEREETEEARGEVGVLECPNCNEQGAFRELERKKTTYGDKVRYRCVDCKHEFTELEQND